MIHTATLLLDARTRQKAQRARDSALKQNRRFQMQVVDSLLALTTRVCEYACVCLCVHLRVCVCAFACVCVCLPMCACVCACAWLWYLLVWVRACVRVIGCVFARWCVVFVSVGACGCVCADAGAW